MLNNQKTNKKASFIIKGKEYRYVNSNPFVKTAVNASITLIDIVLLMLLIWNLFIVFIPFGSWINVVSGTSMDPTMHDGQIIFTDVEAIGRGDIVTSYFPEFAINEQVAKEGTVMVKRVIGVPGDKININSDGVVYVNDIMLDEYYLSNEAISMTYVENGCNSVTLGHDEYFIMGDNRSVSYDSRYFGAVKSSDLLYKQSAKPTLNFYLKIALIVIMFILDIFLYALIEFVLMECADYLLSKCKFCNSKQDVLLNEKTNSDQQKSDDLNINN